MREIIVRGKDTDGVWCHGYLSKDSEGNYRIQSTDRWDDVSYPIIPETVGQFTGLTDRKGADVFEGDIIDIYPTPNQVVRNCIVYFSGGGFRLKMEGKFTQFYERFTYLYDNEIPIEVKGNIFENKELIEK